jgi:phage head maturation protease
VSAPSWQLGDSKPSWFLGDLHQRPRIERVHGPIHRAVLPSPVLIERTASEGAQILDVTFALFNRWTEINSPTEGRFLERISRGAFSKSIRENLAHIKAILSHGKDLSLGETVLGKIETIREEEDRAVARVQLFPSVPPLLLDGLRANVYGASFRGASIKERVEYRPKRSDYNPEALPEVTRTEIKLRDIGPTAFAAYSETSARIGEG